MGYSGHPACIEDNDMCPCPRCDTVDLLEERIQVIDCDPYLPNKERLHSDYPVEGVESRLAVKTILFPFVPCAIVSVPVTFLFQLLQDRLGNPAAEDGCKHPRIGSTNGVRRRYPVGIEAPCPYPADIAQPDEWQQFPPDTMFHAGLELADCPGEAGRT